MLTTSHPKQWTYFRVECPVPGDIYSARLVLTTTGWSGALKLDDLRIVASGEPEEFTIVKQDVYLEPIPGDAEIVMCSTRHHTPGVVGGWAIGDYDPEFSPDGQHVVFGYNRPSGPGWDIVSIGIGGEDRDTLVSGSFLSMMGIPDWSHDGDTILFSEWTCDLLGRPVYIGASTVSPDGTGYTRLEGPFQEKSDGGTHGRWIPPLFSGGSR